MIRKEKEGGGGSDRRAAAGDAAERQMAFYLRRGFEAEPLIVVLNDLRLPLKGDSNAAEDAVQIDHLVIHKHGMVIIESKSVTTRVKINAYGEWSRYWNGQWKGMASPVHQAQLQASGLRGLLLLNQVKLRERRAFGLLQGGFTHCPIEVVVAISVEGTIEEDSVRPPGVLKADAVVEHVKGIEERHRRAAPLLAKPKAGDDNYGIYSFTPSEIERVSEFLIAAHTPHRPSATASSPPSPSPPPDPLRTQSPPVPQAPPSVRPPTPPHRPSLVPPSTAPSGIRPAPVATPPVACRHCGATDGNVQWGKRAYFFRCGKCAKGTDLPTTCTSCGKRARIRKEGPRYWRECRDEGGCGCRSLAWEGAS